jgi:hypothetical protein
MVAALALAATTAWGHTMTAEEMLAALAVPAARAAEGVERAVRDAANPRVLVVRVGPAWFARPRATRAALAAGWWATWRHAVPDGVVAVLDGQDRVVVRFGRGGVVLDVRDEAG